MTIFLKIKAQRIKPCCRLQSREGVGPGLHLLKCPQLRHRPALGPKLLTPERPHLPAFWSALGSFTVHQVRGSPSCPLPSHVTLSHPWSGTVSFIFRTRALRPQVLRRQSWCRGCRPGWGRQSIPRSAGPPVSAAPLYLEQNPLGSRASWG